MFGFYARVAEWLTRATEPAAARHVRELAEARDIPALLALLDHEDYALKGRAASALGRLGDPSALEELARRLDSPLESDQLAGLSGLWRAGDPRRLEPARRWLADATRSSRLRHAAAAALPEPELIALGEDQTLSPDTRAVVEGSLRGFGARP